MSNIIVEDIYRKNPYRTKKEDLIEEDSKEVGIEISFSRKRYWDSASKYAKINVNTDRNDAKPRLKEVAEWVN